MIETNKEKKARFNKPAFSTPIREE